MSTNAIQWFVMYRYQQFYAREQSLEDVVGDDVLYLSRRQETKEVLDALKAGAIPYVERFVLWACAGDSSTSQELVEIPGDWNNYFAERPFLFEKLLRDAPQLGGDRKLVGYIVQERARPKLSLDESPTTAPLGTEQLIGGMIDPMDRYDLLSVGIPGQVDGALLGEGAAVLTQLTGYLTHLYLVFGVKFVEN